MPVLAARGGGKFRTDPLHGRAHETDVMGLAFRTQVVGPRQLGLDALNQRAHEREVTDVNLAPPRGAATAR